MDYSDVYVENDIKSRLGDLPPPEVTDIRHNALILQWDYGKESERNIIRFYRVEASIGGMDYDCSDYWKVIDTVHVQGKSNARAQIEDLIPDTSYCLRLLAVGDHDISRVSLPSIIQTLPAPTNDWWLTFPRDDLEISTGVTAGDTSFCEPTKTPTPRRGHSISFLNGRVYMFGGLTKRCVCDLKSICREDVVYSNEVWMLNAITNIWKLLVGHSLDPSNEIVPTGREQHSASVLPNGEIVMIGGKNKDSIFGDAWLLDAGKMTSHTIMHSKEGASLPLKDGGILYESLRVNLAREASRRNDQTLCVADLVVTIELSHPCLEQIHSISLFGPASTPSSQQSALMGNEATVRIYIGLGDFTTSNCLADTSRPLVVHTN